MSNDDIILNSVDEIQDYMIQTDLVWHDDLFDEIREVLNIAITDERLQKSVWSQLTSTDFFYAPASSKFHANYPMGLAEHVINVLDALLQIRQRYQMSEQTCARLALFHDVCKINHYKPKLLARPKGALRYESNDTFPIGHGEKSVFMVMAWGVVLELHEIVAIRWHMGNYDYSYKQYEAKAKEFYPAHKALQYADMMATDLEMSRGRPY